MHHSFAERRPIVFSVVLLVLFVLAFLVANAITVAFKLPALATNVMGYGVLALNAILLLTRLHWWRASGFRLPRGRARCGSSSSPACQSFSMLSPALPTPGWHACCSSWSWP
ncbi:MAG: hypothetical protein ACLQUY_16590 [Ktedonobacterales bacterium]